MKIVAKSFPALVADIFIWRWYRLVILETIYPCNEVLKPLWDDAIGLHVEFLNSQLLWKLNYIVHDLDKSSCC